MQQVLASDFLLVAFSLLLGGLIGMFWERTRQDRDGGISRRDAQPRDKR